MTKVKWRKKIKLVGLILVAFVFLFFIYKKDELDINVIEKNNIESFDLILSKGQSMQSKLISLLKFSTNDYSHIGILVKENEKLFVLHSTPDGTKTNGIRYDDLQTFLELSSVSDGKILRYRSISDYHRTKLKLEIDRYKSFQKPFDYDFDNFSDKKIYCSELIWIIFKNAEIIEQSHFDLTKPIYPKYFITVKGFTSINFKKSSR